MVKKAAPPRYEAFDHGSQLSSPANLDFLCLQEECWLMSSAS